MENKSYTTPISLPALPNPSLHRRWVSVLTGYARVMPPWRDVLSDKNGSKIAISTSGKKTQSKGTEREGWEGMIRGGKCTSNKTKKLR